MNQTQVIFKVGLVVVIFFSSIKGYSQNRIYHVNVHKLITEVCLDARPPYERNQKFWGGTTPGGSFTVTSTAPGCGDMSFTFSGSGTRTKFCNEPVDGCKTITDLTAKASIFTVPDFSGTNLNSYECVSSETAKEYEFNINRSSSLFDSNCFKSVWIQVSPNSSFAGAVQTQLSLTVSKNTLSYKQLTGSNSSAWYGRDLYYRLRFVLKNYSETSVYGVTQPPMTFIRSVSAPTLDSYDRSACKADIIEIKAASSIVNNYTHYKYRAKPWGEEKEENIFRLTATGVNTTTNIIYLEAPTSGIYKFSEEGGDYELSVFGIELPDDVKLSDYTCVSPMSQVTIDRKPSVPNQTISANSVATVGDTTFHITRYNASDGQIKTTIHNYDQCDDGLHLEVQKNGGAVQNIPITSLSRSGNEWTYSGLEEADYTIKLVDGDGCSSMTTPEPITLYAPEPVRIESLNTTVLVKCNPANGSTNGADTTGEVSLTWSGGLPPYTVYYDGKTYDAGTNTSVILNGLRNQNYTFRVVDNYNVENSQIELVGAEAPILISGSNVDILCYDDPTDITVDLQNDNGENTYELYDLEGTRLDFSSSGLSGNSYTFLGHKAGRYRVDIKSGLCLASDTIDVIQPEEIRVNSLGSKIARYGDSTGTIEINVTGGVGMFHYKLLNSESTTITSGTIAISEILTELKDGYYTVEVEDENHCSSISSNIRVRQPDAPLRLTFTQKNVDCYGNATGEVYPKATGGWGQFQYGWNGSIVSTDTIISSLLASTGSDTVFVVDSAGVFEKELVLVLQPDSLETYVNTINNLLCFEDNSGSAQMDIIGGVSPFSISVDSVIWEQGNTVTGLSAGLEQKVYIRDDNNCIAQAKVNITQPTPLQIAKDTIVDAFCNQSNGGIHMIVVGGTVDKDYKYSWEYVDSSMSIENPAPEINNIYSGRYHLTIIDDNACVADTLLIVSDIDGPKINEYIVDSVKCIGGSDGRIILNNVSGGMPKYSYLINNNPTDSLITDLVFGTHHVRVIDRKGCKDDALINVEQPDSIRIYPTITAPTCHDSKDGSIIVVARGGNSNYSYTWNEGTESPILESINSGDFKVLVSDWKNCSREQTLSVYPPSMPKPDWQNKEALICTGNYVNVDGSDFSAWEWKNEKGESISTERSIRLTETGAYYLFVTDEKACVGVDTFNLTVSDTPLEAGILLPDSARIGETVGAIDVTWPVPDSIQWFFDQEVEVLDSNSWSNRFSSSYEGTLNVTLRTWYDGCYSDSAKTIIIYYEDGFEEQEFKMSGALISGIRAYPNPNNGDFNLDVVLLREAEITLSTHSATDGQMIDKRELIGLHRYEVPFQLQSLKPGVYVITVQAEGEVQRIKAVKE